MILLALLPLARAADHLVVRPGDTLDALAAARGLDAAALANANGLAPGAPLTPGVVLLLPSAPEAEPPAVLHSFLGTGSVRLPGAVPQALAPALPLPEGAEVCTDPGSYATLRLAVDQGSRAHDDLNLWPSTCVFIEALSSGRGERSALVRLGRGSVSLQAAREGEPDGRVTLRTADVVATADGGGHRLHVEEGATRAEALDNPMSLLASGVELRLEPGQGSRTRQGEAPGPPVALLPPGHPASPAPEAPLRVPGFSWTPSDRAFGYVIEIGLDPELRELVYMDSARGTRLEPELLVLPYRAEGFWWRVTAVDGFGFLGPPSDPRHQRFPEGVAP